MKISVTCPLNGLLLSSLLIQSAMRQSGILPRIIPSVPIVSRGQVGGMSHHWRARTSMILRKAAVKFSSSRGARGVKLKMFVLKMETHMRSRAPPAAPLKLDSLLYANMHPNGGILRLTSPSAPIVLTIQRFGITVLSAVHICTRQPMTAVRCSFFLGASLASWKMCVLSL
jgi:hypothetical protein